jgi:hypothetical protein
MRAYTIKRKGKKTWQKMIFEKEITFSENHTITIYAGDIFFRKKDAKEYLGTFKYPEYYEVIGVTIDKSDKDNRKKIIAYKPKGNVPALDLPLISEIVVEDDIERLAKEYSENKSSSDVFKEQHKVDFIAGYKSATKTFSEEDMKEAFNAGSHWKEKWKTVTDDNINIPDVNKFIQSLKQAKI